MIYLMAHDVASSEAISLEAVAKLANPKNIPILVDAAAEDLRFPACIFNTGPLSWYTVAAKQSVVRSARDLVLGKKEILMSAWQASSPHHGPGRDNKVGREEMMGMLAAVEAWIARDHPGEWKRWLTWLDTIAKRVTAIEGIKTSVIEPTDLSNRSPVLVISWDPDKLNITGEEVAEEVGRNKPRIALGGHSEAGSTSIQITTGQMQPGQEKIVADRLFDLFRKSAVPGPQPWPLHQPPSPAGGMSL